ncbi:hypothetical protein Wcon_01001 [Wolbachia endosymbiont of Cylisticus convexus]|uniref:hypothetical protein n=1 Tax=Wolbachia endosymbiont of Cylisticus convexus TaxID=118728 RepID=UPI000DF6E46A|nr:hypothetical protein [Wolbachia endosymbiont of Cylisticus convexus]RDD34878.1 hypothetical protein Wcon_01001 [Wolbachia endosymbiont of Cylisticus convexus]
MDYIDDAAGSYTTIHDFFQNNGIGDYKVQCSYGGVPYATDEYVHSGDKFWSNNFIDSHFGRGIKMYPQSELLAKEYTGNTLPISISLDKDLIKIKECQKKMKFVALKGELGDIVYEKQKHIKCYTTKLSYDDVSVYNKNKVSILNIRYDVPNDPKYSLNIAFTKVNDNQPRFWQKFKNMF